MDSDAIKALHEDLIGTNSRPEVIERVVQEFNINAFKLPQDKIDYNSKEVGLAFIHSAYNERFEYVDRLKGRYLISPENLEMLIALAVDMASARDESRRAFEIIEAIPIDINRMGKCVVSYVDKLLDEDRYEEAGTIWSRYKDKGIPEKNLLDTLKDTFNKAMIINGEPDKHDYTKALQLQKLFNLPKGITYDKVSEHFTLNNKAGNYLVAATLGDTFNFNRSIINEAAFQAWQTEIAKFQKNLENNYYSEFEELGSDDPFETAKGIIERFHIFEYESESETADKTYIKKIQEKAFHLFDMMLKPAIIKGNSHYAIIYVINRILTEYQLINETISKSIMERTQSKIKDVIKLITGELKDTASMKIYMPILENIQTVSQLDIQSFDIMGKKILSLALDEKNLEYAKKVSDTYMLDAYLMAPQLVEYAKKWAEDNLFDLVFDFLAVFDIKNVLLRDDKFMRLANKYYDESLRNRQYLKCLLAADEFSMPHKKRIKPLKMLMDERLKSRDLNEIYNIMKKYKIQRRDVIGSVKMMYKEYIKTDKEYAKRLRKFFNLSVFEIGFFTWLIYEFLGFGGKKKESEQE